MKFDSDRHDGMIHLAANPAKGLWGSVLVYRGARSVRTGGQAPTEMSRHGLLTVAMTSALKTISSGQHRRICREAGVVKPRILVATLDQSFSDAVSAIINGGHEPRLRAGNNLKGEFHRQLTRFDISFTQDEDSDLLFTLQNWVTANVINPREVGNLPKVFVPAAISSFAGPI